MDGTFLPGVLALGGLSLDQSGTMASVLCDSSLRSALCLELPQPHTAPCAAGGWTLGARPGSPHVRDPY